MVFCDYIILLCLIKCESLKMRICFWILHLDEIADEFVPTSVEHPFFKFYKIFSSRYCHEDIKIIFVRMFMRHLLSVTHAGLCKVKKCSPPIIFFSVVFILCKFHFSRWATYDDSVNRFFTIGKQTHVVCLWLMPYIYFILIK
jgi:hypothetical protein